MAHNNPGKNKARESTGKGRLVQVVSTGSEDEAARFVVDPLLQLGGVFECDVTDVGECHDDYIGQSLRTEQ